MHIGYSTSVTELIPVFHVAINSTSFHSLLGSYCLWPGSPRLEGEIRSLVFASLTARALELSWERERFGWLCDLSPGLASDDRGDAAGVIPWRG